MPSLDDLTGSLQDYVREFLPFRDILRSRRLCRSWRDRDINRVKKSLDVYIVLRSKIYPPPIYLATNLRKLTFCDCSDFLNIIYLRDLLYQNARNLEELQLEQLDTVPFQLPIFPKLKCFEMGDCVEQQLLDDIVAKAKKLTHLCINRCDIDEITLDYRYLNSIESITCCSNCYIGQIMNIPPHNSLKIVRLKTDDPSYEQLSLWRDNFANIEIRGSFRLFSFTLTKKVICIDLTGKSGSIFPIDGMSQIDSIKDTMKQINEHGQVRIEWGTEITMLGRCILSKLLGFGDPLESGH